MNLVALPALTDNYIWMLSVGQHALVVDPGQAKPVLAALRREQLQLDAILVTHHHGDHVQGIHELRELTGAQVFGPMGETIPAPYTRVRGRETLELLGHSFSVLDTPGHTAGGVSYYCDPIVRHAPVLFCGDTLFSGGCGRIFDGTAADLHDALCRFARLPAYTRVCCAHEYTLANLEFARTVEPENPALQAYYERCKTRRDQQLPTLPSTIALELDINPFLRVDSPQVAAAIRSQNPLAQSDVELFAALREWKNRF